MSKYQSYKPSGVEWIGEIPVDWKVSKYKYNLSILSGFPFKSELFDNENGFPLLRIRDITSGTIETYYNGDFDDKYIIKKGDVVIGMDGDFNIREWDNDDILLNQRCCKIQGYDNLLLKFIFYTLPIDLKIINDLTYYTTVKHLSVGDLYNINCVLPSLNEQTQIVRFLDEKTELIDRLISTKERKITVLKEQRTSLINEVVTKGLNPNVKMKNSGVEWIGEIPEGWRVGRLGYYSNVFRGSGYQYLNQVDENYLGRKEKVVRISDITEFNPIWCEYTEQFENYRIKKNEILVGGTGHYFGKSIYVTEEMEGLIHSYNIIRLVVKKQYTKYIQYYISSSIIREQMDMSVLGSGQPFIDLQGLKDLIILIPNQNEQLEIIEYLNSKTKEIDELVQLEQKKIDLLKEYRQSLISEVVTGKIKVTN